MDGAPEAPAGDRLLFCVLCDVQHYVTGRKYLFWGYHVEHPYIIKVLLALGISYGSKDGFPAWTPILEDRFLPDF